MIDPNRWRPGAVPGKLGFYLRNRGEWLRRRCYKWIYDYRDRDRAFFSVVWDRPPVIYAGNLGVERLLPLPPGSLVLVALVNTHEDPGLRAATVASLRRHFPDGGPVAAVVLANTPREAELLSADGVRAVFLNHNAFVDERVFVIRPGIPKRFAAIYDAQLGPYKRLELAAEVEDLALISYMHRPSPEMAYARWIRRLLSRATWLNDPLSPDYRRLDADEICAALNASRTGLCLSAAEGAMHASCQYLLCGLPVVTTPSLGGRDVYLDGDFALTVDPTPGAVAAGVRAMAGRRIDPEAIRARALARMRAQRGQFISLVQDHLDRAGVKADFGAHFERIFFHTLLKVRKLSARLSPP